MNVVLHDRYVKDHFKQEAEPMSAKRHKHEFSSFYYHFGPYGRQDVHVHPCRPWVDDESCDRVLIGKDRECDGKADSHHRETLEAAANATTRRR